jgi:hypothetical protein
MTELHDPWAEPAESAAERLRTAAQEVVLWSDALCREGGLIHHLAMEPVDEMRNPAAVKLMAWHLTALAGDLMAVKRHVGASFFTSAVLPDDLEGTSNEDED